MAADKGLISVLVLLDLSAAFDTIDHDILLQRLEQSIGISGTALSWFRSYLSGQSQFVFVNDEASMTTNVNHGVPQGSWTNFIHLLYMLPLGKVFVTSRLIGSIGNDFNDQLIIKIVVN